MKEWTTYHLEDICKEILSGGDAAKYDCVKAKSNTYKYPVFANAIDEDGLYGYCNDYVVNVPSVTIAARGAGTGYVAYRDTPYTPIVRLISLIPKENVNPLFLYYRLKIANLRGDGSAIPQLTVPMVKKLKVTLPDHETQNTIANILRPLDVKIQLNKQINDNLEQQAQALYKSWFVDFEPFKDGEFVESEFGLIPKGWKTGSISDISKISSGKRPAKKCDKKNNIHNIPVYGASGIMAYTNDVLHDSPLLLIGRVGTLGVIQRVNRKSWPSDNTLIIFTQFYNYIYFILQAVDYSAINRGSTQPLITQTDINQEGIVIPSLDVLEQFEDRCNSLYKMIAMHKDENIILETIRDTLLPKLMSGEIKINEIDC